jgi:hypothetical protein
MPDQGEPDDHAAAAGAPGASAPGEPGYEGEVTLGDDPGAPTGPDDPFGRPDDVPENAEELPPDLRARVERVDRLLHDGDE